MNYAKMIEILTWVKDNRKDGRMFGTGTSPYVCDNISHFPGYLASFSDSEMRVAGNAIKKDIKKEINGRFGVPQFLGYEDDDEGTDYNYYPDVIQFRDDMIDRLIARYTAELAE